MIGHELESDSHGLPVRYPAPDDTREDASGFYPTHTAAEEAALDEEHALWDAMDAARRASGRLS